LAIMPKLKEKNEMKKRSYKVICILLILGVLLSSVAFAANSDDPFDLNEAAFALELQESVNPMIAAGLSHTVALAFDGKVWAWGSNSTGQLGDGTTINRDTPIQVLNLANVSSIAAGDNHTVALRDDGTVWAWGFNGNGQLGNGTTINRNTPVRVQNLANVVSITAGDNHTVALKYDGTVWAWGSNSTGQLGDGTLINRHTPTQVSDHDGQGFLNLHRPVHVQPEMVIVYSPLNWHGEFGCCCQVEQLRADVFPPNANQTVSWSSDAPHLIDVNQAGEVFIVSFCCCFSGPENVVTITATAEDGTSGSFPVWADLKMSHGLYDSDEL
jgi:hypothetical protein